MLKSKLPDLPSKLLEVALLDLEKLEKNPAYSINMDNWHSVGASGKCRVCLAGCVMTLELGADIYDDVAPSRYPSRDADKLWALNQFRCGRIIPGILYLGEELEYRYKGKHCVPVVPYEDNPEDFKRDMVDLIVYLESQGL